MSGAKDNFKSTIFDLKNKLDKIKLEYKLDTINNSLSNEQKENLKYSLQKIKKELINFKDEYLNSNYRSVLSENEDINRKDELDEILSQCDNLIKTHCKIEYINNIKEEDYKDKEFNNPYEQLLYQQKKLSEHDELINNIISKNKETKEIGKQVKSNLTDQNKKISQIGRKIDETQKSAIKLNTKFTDFILDSSFCKLYIIIGVLAFILLWLWI